MDYAVYIPKYNGNDQDPDPMTIEVHPLSHGEVAKYGSKIERKAKRGFRGQETTNALAVQKLQFTENTRAIKNFILYDENGEEEIVTESAVFYEKAPFPLVQEILEVMEEVSALTEAEEKNSG